MERIDRICVGFEGGPAPYILFILSIPVSSYLEAVGIADGVGELAERGVDRGRGDDRRQQVDVSVGLFADAMQRGGHPGVVALRLQAREKGLAPLLPLGGVAMEREGNLLVGHREL